MLQYAIFVILAIGVRFTVHQMVYQRDCVDLECERTTFEKTITELSDANGTIEQCSGCQHCTINGYSVCVRLRETALRVRRAPDETIGVCGCVHNIPRTCDAKPTRKKSNNASTKLFNICYLSALQSPPRPHAENRQSSVIVTIEPFWLLPYWSELRLSNLTVHYEFPVSHAENCDGDIIQVAADGRNNICSASLPIEMGESETDNVEDEAENQLADVNNLYEDDGVSEVQFDRAVFAGAENVKFWYTVHVERPRQLNPRRTDDAVIDVYSVIDSGSLEFDLETNIYGFGDGHSDGNFPDDIAKWKEEDIADDGHMNTNDVDRGMENAESDEYEYGHREKTAEEVAKEVDFFAADDEVRPIPQDGDEEPGAIEADSDDYSSSDTRFAEGSEQNENSAELSTGNDDDEADADFDENFVDKMDSAQNSGQNRTYITADRRFDELEGEADEKNGGIDGGTDEYRRIDETGTGSYGISSWEDDEEGRAIDSHDASADNDMNAQTATIRAEKDDVEGMMSNEAGWNKSDEAVRTILQHDRGGAHRHFDVPTLSTAAEIGHRELGDGEEISEEEEPGRIAFHDDMDAAQTVHDSSSANSIDDEEMVGLSTPDHAEVTTGNHSLFSNGTKAVFKEFIDKITTKHIGLTTYALGLAILGCVLVLCVFCCVRKRERLCACCNGNNSRRGKNLHRNGINNSYMYTPANTQNMNMHPERERLN